LAFDGGSASETPPTALGAGAILVSNHSLGSISQSPSVTLAPAAGVFVAMCGTSAGPKPDETLLGKSATDDSKQPAVAAESEADSEQPAVASDCKGVLASMWTG
jgi:hypothetical protein